VGENFTAQNIAVSGSRAVVTGAYTPTNTARLKVLDVSVPSAPLVIGELPTSVPVGSSSGFTGVALNAAGTMAVAALPGNGVWVIDLSHPSAPAVIGTFNNNSAPRAVALNNTGNLVYVANSAAVLQILNISTPSAPTLVGSLSIPYTVLRGVAVSGGIAALANQQGTIEVADVSNPASPRWLGRTYPSGFAFHVAMGGTQAVILSGSASTSYLDKFDLSNPASPVRTGSVVIGGPSTGSGGGVTVANGRAYVAATTGGLQVYDLTPATPVLLTTTATVGSASDVALGGTMAYVATTPGLLNVLSLAQ
jgi:hypothetical protein